MKTVGILYICTGKYTIFWEEFYKSCEKYLLTGENFEKEYFVFTDAASIIYESNNNVNRIEQESLPWPFITLYRFKIFNKHKALYNNIDYLYYFNANMQCIKNISSDFLPGENQDFSFLQHPGYYNKEKKDFTYERNMTSTAGIKELEGKFYFAGGLNGGEKEAYLKMCETLEENIDKDLEKKIIAVWHDESHLNKYAIDHHEKIKVLDPSYGYPEGWDLPFEPKIIILDKNNFGGHDLLRNNNISFLKRIWGKMFL